MPTAARTPSIDPEVRKLQAFLDRELREGRAASQGPRKVLEAGCGSLTHLDLDDAYVVGIDISARQLERHPRLREAICGDIQTYELPARAFDLIICWDVLEHLAEPRQALENFVRAVRPGGLILLAMPHLLSIKGILAKLTPYRLHVWAYRRFWGVDKAGTDDLGPFPTYLRLATVPAAVRRFARARGLTVEYFSAYESLMQKRFRSDHRLMSAVFAGLGAASRLLTLGRLDVNHTDYILVLRKPVAGRSSRPAG